MILAILMVLGFFFGQRQMDNSHMTTFSTMALVEGLLLDIPVFLMLMEKLR